MSATSTAAEHDLAAGLTSPLEPVRAHRDGRDFGRVTVCAPRFVVRARCEQDIVHALRVAARHGLTVGVQGARHSCAGQSLAADGILLRNFDRDEDVPPPRDDGTIELSARSAWRSVEERLNRVGRTIPVLADYLDLSVGGTLSVGGYGVDSIAHGAQVDQVDRLRLILADGTARWCSPDQDAELFGFALAGLGQIGIIERVVLRTAAYRPVTTLFIYRHRSLGDLIRSLAWLTEDPIPPVVFFKALAARGRFVSYYGVPCASLGEALSCRSPRPTAAPATRRIVPGYRRWRSLAVTLWVARFGRCRRIWSDYLVDYEGLRDLGDTVESLQQEQAFGNGLKAIYIVGVRRPQRAVDLPLEALGSSGPALRFGMGLYSMVGGRDDATLGDVRTALRLCLRRAVDLGGRPYLYGHHDLDGRMLQQAYGDGWSRLRELRRTIDPNGVLAAARHSPVVAGGRGSTQP